MKIGNEQQVKKKYCVLDIETIVNPLDGSQLPFIVTICFDGEDEPILFMLDRKYLENQDMLDEGLNVLWTEVLDTLLILKIETIFVHNLGGFDGFFIYKGLLNIDNIVVDNISTLIDESNKFITISYKYQIEEESSDRYGNVKIKTLIELYYVYATVSYGKLT